jgi:hypothetical protein
MPDQELLMKLDCLQEAYIATATSDPGDISRFTDVRGELLGRSDVKALLPDFVSRFRTLEQFWSFIRRKYSHYGERREYIWTEFARSVQYAEGRSGAPSDGLVSQGLETLEASHIHHIWEKALDRRNTDPEGAITAARTLLESVCKLILDEGGIAYESDATLPKLYSLVASSLNLAPSMHTEKVFKQILGGCHSVVDGLGSVRNRLSDAHGQGKAPVLPAPRHAELVVNLAGAVAVFLAATWTYAKDKAS